jgi:tRNA (guanine-N7-)-methyltransferase
VHPLFSLSETISPSNREEMHRYFFDIFGNHNPLLVEIGSGNGHFLVECAMCQNGRNFIGTEILGGRARKFHSKIVKRKLQNIVVFKGDARQFVWEYLYEETVEEFIILFPDPWPKNRHHKHRILTSAFIQMLRVRLKNGGLVSIATDSSYYWYVIFLEFEKNGGFSVLLKGGFGEYPGNFPSTIFQERFKKERREIYFMQFQKNPEQSNKLPRCAFTPSSC